jgi:hypothetical protein
MATMTTLKIKCQDIMHRVPLQSHQANYESIMETIQNIYPGEVNPKYLDDEGDMCVLNAATFSDFLNLSRSAGDKTVFRVELFPAVPVSTGAQPAERAELKTASPTGTSSYVLQEPKGNFKGKGKCKGNDECKDEGKGNFKGKGKGKGKCKGESRLAIGFEELLHNFGRMEGLMQQQGAEGSSLPGTLATLCALGAHDGRHASGVMKLGRALWQLYSAGMRSARCVAAVVANSLDDLVTFAVEQSDAIDMAASIKPEVTQKVMEVLFASAVGVEGLEDSAGKMEAALAGEPISASEVLLGLLTWPRA